MDLPSLLLCIHTIREPADDGACLDLVTSPQIEDSRVQETRTVGGREAFRGMKEGELGIGQVQSCQCKHSLVSSEYATEQARRRR